MYEVKCTIDFGANPLKLNFSGQLVGKEDSSGYEDGII